jgi:hypothetical protein
MIGYIWRGVTWPFRAIPWYVWLAGLAVAAWFGRNILLIIATIIAFHPIPVPPLFQADPATVLAGREQDIRQFDHVRRNERSLDDAGRSRFDAALEAVQADMASMTDAEFQLGLARAQAVIDNGHSNASATRMVESFERLPIRTAFMNGDLHVLRTLVGHEDLLGAEVTHINGVPVMDAAWRFRDAFGGNDPFFLSFAPLFLETPAYLAAVDLGDEDARYRFVLTDGSVSERVMVPAPIEDGASRKFSGDLPMPWQRESDQWIAFAPAGDALHLRNPNSGYWLEALPDMDAVYVSLRMNLDDDSGESLVAFIDRAISELETLAPSVIILDQRFNGGGDLTRTQPLMTAFADIVGPDGQIYLLANGNTFSAGIVNLAMVKEAAPDRTVIVGSEIGDRLQFWAEGWWYSLKNSGFRARYSTGYYDLQNGCEGVFRCHWGSLHIFPVIVDDLDVDISAPLSFDAYAEGRDPGLDAIIAAEMRR